MSLAFNDPQKLREQFQAERRQDARASAIQHGVVVGGEAGAFVRARQEAAGRG